MASPAMGIGQFLAAALGTMAVGGASGMAQMKIREELDTKKFIMQSLQKALFDKTMEGFTPTEEMSKAAFGSFAKQVHPILVGMGQARQQAMQARDRMGFVQPGEGEGGAQGTLMGPAAVSPGMQMGGGAPNLAAPPSAAPQPGDILGMMAGGPAAAQAMGRPSAPVSPQAEPTSTPFEQTIRPQAEPGALRPGMTRPGVTMSMPGPGGGTMTLPDSAKAQVKSLMTWANSAGATPRRLQEQAAKVGATIPKDVYDQYAEMDYNKNLPSYLAQAAIEGATGEAALQQAMLKMGYERGWTPPALLEKTLPNQASRDEWFANFRAIDGGKTPLAKLFDAAAILKIPISPDARKQATEAATANATSAAIAKDPKLRGNPSALARIVWEALGYSAQSPEATALMNQLAPVSAPTAEQLTIQGKAQPLAANVGAPPAPAGAATGETGVTSGLDVAVAKRAAEITAARETEHLAAAREVGKATGERAARDITIISKPQELEKYVDPVTGNTPPAMTQTELDARIRDGSLGMLHTTPEIYKDYRVFKEQVGLYETVVDRPNSIFSKSFADRTKLRLAAAPWTIEMLGFKVMTQLPPLTELRKMGLSSQDIQDMNTIVSANRLAVAHLRSLGEKGQGVSSKMFEMGAEAFPNPFDDQVSAKAKINALNSFIDVRLRNSVSVQTPQVPSSYKGVKIEPLPGGR